MNIIIILAALLPAFLLLLYVWKKDPQKEPTSELVKAILWGMGICVPVALLEMGIEAVLFSDAGATTLLGTTTRAFLVAALPEESFKLLALWWVLRKNPYFDEHFDGIVYDVCIGLGFAAIENIAYLLGTENWVSVAITRSLLAVPGHYAFAVLMGYYYSVYHFVDHSRKTAICILLVPVVFHGIYDALALSGIVDPYIGGISFFILIYFCIKVHKKARKKILALIEKDKQLLASAQKLQNSGNHD